MFYQVSHKENKNIQLLKFLGKDFQPYNSFLTLQLCFQITANIS